MPRPAAATPRSGQESSSLEGEDLQAPLIKAEERIDGLLRQLLDAYQELRAQMASLREENTALERHLWGPSQIFEDAYELGDPSHTCTPPELGVVVDVLEREPDERVSSPQQFERVVTPQQFVDVSKDNSGGDAQSAVEDMETSADVQAHAGHNAMDRHVVHHNVSQVWEKAVRSKLRNDTVNNVDANPGQVPDALGENKLEAYDGFIAKFISSPNSSYRAAWDLGGFFFIFYDLIAIPLRAFDPPENALTVAVDWIVLLYWTWNVIMSLLVGYEENGVVIMKPTKILLRYVKTWFLVDTLVLVPDWTLTIQSLQAEGSQNKGGSVRLLRILRLTKCLRLLRAAKLKKLFQKLTDNIDSEYTGIMVNISKMILLLLLVNHFIASFWYTVGTIESTNSWVHVYGYDTKDWITKYTVSFHWSITQFTPASKVNIQPVNIVERLYAVFVVIFALVGFSYIVGSITGSLTQLRAIAEDADKQFYQVRRYLRQNQVSHMLGSRIQRFLENAYAKSKKRVDGRNIAVFALLSDSLKGELQLEIALPHLKAHPLFCQISLLFMPTLKRIVSTCIDQQILAVGDMLFFPGESATHMYFIETGRLKYVGLPTAEGEMGRVEFVERTEDWLAEAAIWTEHWVHVGTPSALLEAEVLRVSPTSFSQTVNLNPAAFDLVSGYAKNFVTWLNSDITHSQSDVYQGELMFREFAKSLRLDEEEIEKATRHHQTVLSIFG